MAHLAVLSWQVTQQILAGSYAPFEPAEGVPADLQVTPTLTLTLTLTGRPAGTDEHRANFGPYGVVVAVCHTHTHTHTLHLSLSLPLALSAGSDRQGALRRASGAADARGPPQRADPAGVKHTHTAHLPPSCSCRCEHTPSHRPTLPVGRRGRSPRTSRSPTVTRSRARSARSTSR